MGLNPIIGTLELPVLLGKSGRVLDFHLRIDSHVILTYPTTE